MEYALEYIKKLIEAEAAATGQATLVQVSQSPKNGHLVFEARPAVDVPLETLIISVALVGAPSGESTPKPTDEVATVEAMIEDEPKAIAELKSDADDDEPAGTNNETSKARRSKR